MVSETQQFDGSGHSSVDIYLDELIVTEFTLDALVSPTYSGKFSKPAANHCDFASENFNTKSFLSLIAAIRQNGWNVIGLTSSYNENSEHVKTFYFEYEDGSTGK